MLDKTKFTNEDLSGLYQALYEMNLAGMDPEFLDFYEGSYAPENVLADGMSQEDLCRAINSLIGELVDDLGSEEAAKEWFLECGGTAKLYEDVATLVGTSNPECKVC